MSQHGISQERFFRAKPDDKAAENVIFDIASHAHQHYEKAMVLMPKVPKEAKISFLPAVTTRRFLERLRHAHFNLNDKKVVQRDSLLPLALYWNKFRKF